MGGRCGKRLLRVNKSTASLQVLHCFGTYRCVLLITVFNILLILGSLVLVLILCVGFCFLSRKCKHINKQSTCLSENSN